MIRLSAALAALLCLSLVAPAAEAARRPNIVLIMADDLGYETIGANGGQSYETPQLDRLAATGVRFDRCFVQPLCTPTRVELMTGQSNVRNYVKFGHIDPQVTTFAQLFKQAGYATAIAGKWQLGRQRDLPQKLGFEESCLWQHTRLEPRYANPGLEYNGQERDFNDGQYGPDLVNEFALDFITRHQGEPFLLYYPMILTHAPNQPTPDSPDWDPAAVGEEVNRHRKHFGEMVAYMDKLIGNVVARLDELGIQDDTLVIFLGDNGTGPGIVSRLNGADYQGGKGQSTARGMHVPLIVNWPSHAPAGAVCDELVSSVDFFPTLCAAAGIQPRAELKLDGHSFLPQILGKEGAARPPIYSWYGQRGGGDPTHEFAMSKQYKRYKDGRFYDLAADPLEESPPIAAADFTEAQSAAARELAAVLDSYADARPVALRGPAPPPERPREWPRRPRAKRAAAAAQ